MLFQPQEVNPDAEWASVFHSARPFNPYHIPLPIRMGRAEPGSAPPAALGNLELMKVSMWKNVEIFTFLFNFF